VALCDPFPYTGRAGHDVRLTRVVALIDLVFLGGFFAALLYGAGHLAFFERRPTDILFARVWA